MDLLAVGKLLSVLFSDILLLAFVKFLHEHIGHFRLLLL